MGTAFAEATVGNSGDKIMAHLNAHYSERLHEGSTVMHAAASHRGARGFTLIELMVIVTIIAVLAAIAIPQFLEYQASAFDARANSDLRNAANAEEAYFLGAGEYLSCTDTDCEAQLPNFRKSATVEITLTANNGANPTWVGVASSERGKRVFTWDSNGGGMSVN